MTTEERLKEIEEKLDRALHTIEALGRILIRSRTATQRGVLHNTITKSDKLQKFEEIGHRRTYVEIGEVGVIPQRKKRSRK